MSDCLGGVKTYKLKIEKAVNFYKANTSYWGVSDDPATTPIDEIYRKTTSRNDKNRTYKLTDTYNENTGVRSSIEASAISGINGLGKETDGTFYFVPNELYIKSGTTYELADEYSSGETYYKMREVVIKSDPIGQFNVGERWNPELDLDAINALPERSGNNKLVLGLKIAEPALHELVGYTTGENTLNGQLLALNKLLGTMDDPDTRDPGTIQGLINSLNDKIDSLGNLASGELLIADMYGHLDGAIFEGDNNWIEIVKETSGEKSSFTVNHKNPVTVAAPSVSNETPNFGGTITLTDLAFDAKGHKANSATHTITLPKGSFTQTADKNVVTSLSFTDATGALNATRMDLRDIPLGGSGNISSSPEIKSTDTLGTALNTIINSASAASYKVKDFEISASSGDVISSLALLNGTLTASKTYIGNAVLSTYSTTTNTNAITNSDTIVGAMAKLQSQINALSSSVVTGIKGSSESTYRTGNVNITKANIGLDNVNNTADADKNVNSAIYDGENHEIATYYQGKVLSGLTEPNDDIGIDGDVYIMYKLEEE